MTRFRPCIDLHAGRVKQIVGGSWRDDGKGLRTNFESDKPAEHFASLYREDGLRGGHVILLGPGNEAVAEAALRAYPGGLQAGGGVRPDNARWFLDCGASHVIVTSYLFDPKGSFRPEALSEIVQSVGREQLVVDLSCRREGAGWRVATQRWQQATDLLLTPETLSMFERNCAELLVHAADVEGRCEGIDEELVTLLGGWGKLPVTYAGGARSLDDLERVERLSCGRVDLTIGSALDIFGGDGVRYADCVAWNQRMSTNGAGHKQ
jgi:phosphoribosylformimino-5-aminoimidazole carboxamide ribotide isomerase